VNTQLPLDIEMGYSDFWPVMLKKYERFCALTQTFGPTIDDLFSQGHREPLHKVCRHLSKMVSNSLSAVLLLGMNGFGVDAIKIARTMFEAAVTVAYLRKYPAEVDDYLDFHFIVANKRYCYMKKYTPELLTILSPEAIENSTKGYARVAPRFTNKNGQVRGRWSKKSFNRICADVGLEEHHPSFYALASNITHADFSGLAAQADREPGLLDVEIAPSEQFVGLAFRTAHFAFVLSATEYIALARPDKQEVADKLNEDFVAAWKKS
jgi:Family of unknown function (DUF5677)